MEGPLADYEDLEFKLLAVVPSGVVNKKFMTVGKLSEFSV